MARYRDYARYLFPQLTPAVRALLVITSAIFVLTYFPARLAGFGLPYYLFGLEPYSVTHNFYVWQLATYLFLHAGFFHIIFNMFVLWQFGPDLESLWGSQQFVFFYFFTGVGAGLIDVLAGPNSPTLTIGCSGALFGIMIAWALLFPDRLIYLYMLIPIKAKWFVLIIGTIEFINELSQPGSGISHIAHLGGLLFGYIYIRGLGLPNRFQHRYDEWRRARLRKRFEIYMRRHDKKDDRDRWVN
jgi:membrane associated rhomboid family serine protease